MSRALNLDATQDDVLATCARKNASVTQIEALASGVPVVAARSDSLLLIHP